MEDIFESWEPKPFLILKMHYPFYSLIMGPLKEEKLLDFDSSRVLWLKPQNAEDEIQRFFGLNRDGQNHIVSSNYYVCAQGNYFEDPEEASSFYGNYYEFFEGHSSKCKAFILTSIPIVPEDIAKIILASFSEIFCEEKVRYLKRPYCQEEMLGLYRIFKDTKKYDLKKKMSKQKSEMRISSKFLERSKILELTEVFKNYLELFIGPKYPVIQVIKKVPGKSQTEILKNMYSLFKLFRKRIKDKHSVGEMQEILTKISEIIGEPKTKGEKCLNRLLNVMFKAFEIK